MSVFVRHRRAPAAGKTVWKKYTIAYTGTASVCSIITCSGTASISTSKSKTANVTYYDTLSFAADGTATPSGENSLSLAYNSYTNANKMNGKVMLQGGSFYYILSDAATRNTGSYTMSGKTWYTAWVNKQTYGAMTAETAKSFTTAGDYVEDVESEDADAYPDNGPLGTYYYVKQ